jgi:DHA2 family multidrug resistance protein
VADAPPAAAPAHAESFSKFNPWLTAVVATLPTFMEVLNTSIANVTLPHISGSLSAAIPDSTWVLTSYLIANAIVMPLSGWLAALFGRRNFYVGCVIVFTLASVLCGIATSLPMLVVFRLIQGLGGGGLQPITQAILVDTFPPRQRAMGMAVYGMTVVVAPVVGPIVGGWVAEEYSWRWIFLLNVPIGAISAFLAAWIIADPPYLVRRTSMAVDWTSIGLLSMWLGCLQMMLDLGERHDWFSSDLIFNLMLVSGVCGVAFLVRQWHHPEPVINLRLLLERNFLMSTIVMALFGFMLYATTVLLPLFMQELLGYTSSRSGMALAPGGLAIMVLMPVVGKISPLLDTRWMIAAGYAVIGVSLWMMGGFTLGVSFNDVAIARTVQGIGLAFTFVPINTLAYAYVARHHRNEASALLSLARNVGASIGISITTVLVSRGEQAHRALMIAHATVYDPAYRSALAAGTSAAYQHGGDPAAAVASATTSLSNLISLQSSCLSYLDQFALLAFGVLLMIPPVLAMRLPAHHDR